MNCDRFDLATFFDGKFDKIFWDGDDENFGVYFDEHHGYIANRVLYISFNHCDDVMPLFYRMGNDVSLDDKITTTYPFSNFVKRPQKRVLLFNESQITLPLTFEGDVICQLDMTKDNVSDILASMDCLKNKRERKKTTVSFQLLGDDLVVEIFQFNKKVRLKKNRISIKVSNASNNVKPLMFDFNMANILEVLGVIVELQDIKMQIQQNLAKFTGLYKVDNRTSLITVVVSLGKGGTRRE